MTFRILRYWQTRTHCCRHKCFPVCPRAQHLLQTQILCLGHKNVPHFVQKHFVSATNVSQFAQPKKHHEQQCVRNRVSSFASTFSHTARTMPSQPSISVSTTPSFHLPWLRSLDFTSTTSPNFIFISLV